jgi:hypothetical protein
LDASQCRLNNGNLHSKTLEFLRLLNSWFHRELAYAYYWVSVVRRSHWHLRFGLVEAFRIEGLESW